MSGPDPSTSYGSFSRYFVIGLPFLLLSLLFAVLRWRYWVRIIMDPELGSANPQSKVVWPFRPSNILLGLGSLFLLYIYLGRPKLGYLDSFNIPMLMIIASFVLRYWENQAAKNVDLLPSDLPPDDEDSSPPPPPSPDE